MKKKLFLLFCGLIFIGVIIKSMATYNDSGFDTQLLRETKLNSPELSPVQMEAFTSELDGNKLTTTLSGNLVGEGINASNITAGQMSFDRAQGGTLVLGGQNNQNGIFSLRNDSDKEKILMDKDGMTITEGNIVIKDKANKTIIDSDGLISNTNFFSEYRSGNPNTAFTSTSYAVATGSGINFILKRSAKVLFLFSVTSSVGRVDVGQDMSGTVYYAAHRDGIELSPVLRIDADFNNTTTIKENVNSKTYSGSIIQNIVKGSHYVDLRYRVQTGTNIQPTLNEWTFGIVILGN